MERKLQERMIGAVILILLLVILGPVILDGGSSDPVPDRLPPGQTVEELHTYTFPVDRADKGRGAVPPDPAAAVDPASAPPPPSGAQAAAPAVPVVAGSTPGSDAPEGASGGALVEGVESTVQPRSKVEQRDGPVVPPPPVAPDAVSAPSVPDPASAAAGPAKVVAGSTESAAGGWVVQVGVFGERRNAERLSVQLRERGFEPSVSVVTRSSRALFRVRVGPPASREQAEALSRRLAAAGAPGQVVPR